MSKKHDYLVGAFIKFPYAYVSLTSTGGTVECSMTGIVLDNLLDSELYTLMTPFEGRLRSRPVSDWWLSNTDFTVLVEAKKR